MDVIWISKKILSWDTTPAGGRIVNRNTWQRSYKIWEHSKCQIELSNNDFQLTDGIFNLKRCLNHRLKLIEKIYRLNKIEIDDKQKGYLELLERFDIVRPFIMKVLLDIRNNIEHNDADPPSFERCKEFVDVIWYFLKSTDSIVQIVKNSINYQFYDEDENETQYGFNVEVDFEYNTDAKICGWFPNDYIYYDQQNDFIKVIVEEIHDKSKVLNPKDHVDKSESDLWLIGELCLDPKSYGLLLKQLFSVTY